MAEQVDVSLFDIPSDLIAAFISLMINGKCESHKAFYKNHTRINGALYASVEINLPLDRSKRGSISLISIEDSEYAEPQLSADIKNYAKMTYLGYNVYLHPEHASFSRTIDRGGQTADVVERVGIFIVVGRGCFSFKL